MKSVLREKNSKYEKRESCHTLDTSFLSNFDPISERILEPILEAPFGSTFWAQFKDLFGLIGPDENFLKLT